MPAQHIQKPDGVTCLGNNMENSFASKPLLRMLRVADQACTAHAILRDKYRRLYVGLDCVTLLMLTWILMMVFVQPEIAVQLSPSFVNQTIWIGILSFLVFVLTFVQFVVDWRGCCQDHHQAVVALSAFVKEYRAKKNSVDMILLDKAALQYRLVSDTLIQIPENDFLRLKRKHLIKVEISRQLDTAPGTSIFLLSLRLWFRDNSPFRMETKKSCGEDDHET